MWTHYDEDQNGFLGRNEAKEFVSKFSEIIEEDRGKNYNPDKFDEQFDKLDDNNDSYLSRGEMAVFIKKIFANNL